MDEQTYSKTTFVTVNRDVEHEILEGLKRFKNNFCYC